MSVYPENPPGQAFVSQDTYASPGVALSGLGGGGGSAGPNLEVSTLTVAYSSSSTPYNSIRWQNDSGSLDTNGILATYDRASSSLRFLGIDANGVFPGQITIPSLISVSSINGVAYSGGGSAGPNLTVSTLTVNPDINIGKLTAPNVEIVGSGFLTLDTDTNNTSSSNRLLFNRAGFSTLGTGQVSLQNQGGVLTAVLFSSGFGATVPVACGSLIVGGDDPSASGQASLYYSTVTSTLNVQAPNVSISSLLGVSSINGVNWDFITSTLAG